MESEILAALVGGVVGAVAVGFVNMYQEASKANSNAKTAHSMFADVHKKWLEVCTEGSAIQQRDCPVLFELLREILPLVLNSGCDETKKNFLSYLMCFRQHTTYVQNGQYGLASFTRDKLAGIMKKEVSALESNGILSIFDPENTDG